MKMSNADRQYFYGIMVGVRAAVDGRATHVAEEILALCDCEKLWHVAEPDERQMLKKLRPFRDGASEV